MDCQNFRNNLFAYTEESLSPETRKAFELHAASCPECSNILDEFKKTMAFVGVARNVEPPAFAEVRMMKKLEQYQVAAAGNPWPGNMSPGRILYFSLGAIAAILIGVMIGYAGEGKIIPGNRTKDPVEIMRNELNVPAEAEEDVVHFSN